MSNYTLQGINIPPEEFLRPFADLRETVCLRVFNNKPSSVNESRVFRLPGFNHCKEEPVLVECIKFNPELRYIWKELDAVLPEIPDEENDRTTAPGTNHQFGGHPQDREWETWFPLQKRLYTPANGIVPMP